MTTLKKDIMTSKEFISKYKKIVKMNVLQEKKNKFLEISFQICLKTFAAKIIIFGKPFFYFMVIYF